MIVSLGFALNVEISGNMKNQRDPFSHKSEFGTSAQVLCFINTPGPKMHRNENFKNKRFSCECPVYLFGCLGDFNEKPIFPIRKRIFAISPDRIGEKLDSNLGLE